MNDSSTLDRLLDSIITEAAPIAAENIGKDFSEPETVKFSSEHETAMRKIFRKERNKLLIKKILRHSKRVAVFLLAVIIVLSITVFSVEAWRIKALNFIIEMNKSHSQINFGGNNAKGNSYAVNGINLGYIPEGFMLEKKDANNNMASLVFKGEKYYFIFSMSDIANTLAIDTESASIKKTNINGQDALFSSNNNVNILVWHDEELSFSLSGTIEENEMVRIAENIDK
jgi:hypothetical protein